MFDWTEAEQCWQLVIEQVPNHEEDGEALLCMLTLLMSLVMLGSSVLRAFIIMPGLIEGMCLRMNFSQYLSTILLCVRNLLMNETKF